MRIILLMSFASLAAFFSWRTFVEPVHGQYRIVGSGLALQAESDARQLYLRHTFYAPTQPNHGWVQVVAQDHVRLFVNGQPVAEKELPGFAVGAITDVSRYLQPGKNVFAIVSRTADSGQPGIGISSVGESPRVTVSAAYQIGRERFEIDCNSAWRCSTTFDRTSTWWFEKEFDDNQWSKPQVISLQQSAAVDVPPQAIRLPRAARWIGPTGEPGDEITFARRFNVRQSSSSSWLRIESTSPFRVAMNGSVVFADEASLGTVSRPEAVCHILDLSPVIRRGKNTIEVLMTERMTDPRVRADLKIRNTNSSDQFISTDDQWFSYRGQPVWDRVESSYWQKCRVYIGELGVPQWLVPAELRPIQIPWSVRTMQVVQICLLFVAWVGGAWIACRLAENFLTRDTSAKSCIYLALVMPTATALLAALSVYDPRILPEDIYQPHSIGLMATAVVTQWSFILVVGRVPIKQCIAGRTWRRGTLTGLTLLAIAAAGFMLRWNEIGRKPLQHDEASAYRSTLGFFERGFPSRQIHADMPAKRVETSELVYVFDVVAACIFAEDRMVVRFPAVVWGTGTILLLFAAGRRFANDMVALLAATIYALAPIAIQMSSFGRYFTQLQFFTLLTVCCFWKTIRNSGPVDRKLLVWTTICFLAMYFTWQGSVLLAPE